VLYVSPGLLPERRSETFVLPPLVLHSPCCEVTCHKKSVAADGRAGEGVLEGRQALEMGLRPLLPPGCKEALPPPESLPQAAAAIEVGRPLSLQASRPSVHSQLTESHSLHTQPNVLHQCDNTEDGDNAPDGAAHSHRRSPPEPHPSDGLRRGETVGAATLVVCCGQQPAPGVPPKEAEAGQGMMAGGSVFSLPSLALAAQCSDSALVVRQETSLPLLQ